MSKLIDAVFAYLIHSLPQVLIPFLGFGVGAVFQSVRKKQPDRGVIALAKNVPAVFVFPDRVIASTSSATNPRTYVTCEDMGAMDAVQSTFIRAGVKPHMIVRREASRFGDSPHGDDYQANVVLICSVKGNPVTGEFVDMLKRFGSIDWGFECQSDGRWCITAKGRSPWISPSYDQELTLNSLNKAAHEGPLEDYAILARLPNPFNPVAKIFIVAGIRGVGTRGAGEFFDKQIGTIWKHTKGRDFVAVLKVRYADYRVDSVTVVHWDVRD